MLFHDKNDELISINNFYDLINEYKNKNNISYYIYEGYGHTLYDFAPNFKEKILEYFRS